MTFCVTATPRSAARAVTTDTVTTRDSAATANWSRRRLTALTRIAPPDVSQPSVDDHDQRTDDEKLHPGYEPGLRYPPDDPKSNDIQTACSCLWSEQKYPNTRRASQPVHAIQSRPKEDASREESTERDDIPEPELDPRSGSYSECCSVEDRPRGGAATEPPLRCLATPMREPDRTSPRELDDRNRNPDDGQACRGVATGSVRDGTSERPKEAADERRAHCGREGEHNCCTSPVVALHVPMHAGTDDPHGRVRTSGKTLLCDGDD